GVQCNGDGVFTHGLERAVRQADVALHDGFEARLDQTVGDVQRADGTKQTAVNAGLLDQGQGVAVELLADGLSRSQLFSLGLFQLSTACFEFLDGSFGGTTGDALGNQVVAGVTVAHTHDIAKVAQVDDFFEQNDLHDFRPRISCGCRCKATGPGSGHA